MAARLTSTGVTFSDGTSLNSKYGIVPQNAVSIFYQSGAPTGWTRLPAASDHNNKALRVVSGTGGGSGGTTAFTSVFPNSTIPISLSGSVTGTVGNHTLSTPELPNQLLNALPPAANGSRVELLCGVEQLSPSAMAEASTAARRPASRLCTSWPRA